MILLSSPLKLTGNHGKHIFLFLEIEIVTAKIVSSKSLKKICRQLLSTVNNVLNCLSKALHCLTIFEGLITLLADITLFPLLDNINLLALYPSFLNVFMCRQNGIKWRYEVNYTKCGVVCCILYS